MKFRKSRIVLASVAFVSMLAIANTPDGAIDCTNPNYANSSVCYVQPGTISNKSTITTTTPAGGYVTPGETAVSTPVDVPPVVEQTQTQPTAQSPTSSSGFGSVDSGAMRTLGFGEASAQKDSVQVLGSGGSNPGVWTPPPATKTCPDGSVVLAAAACPSPPPVVSAPASNPSVVVTPTQTCSDGSVIPVTSSCPTIVSMKTCPDGSVINTADTCPATALPTKTCPDGSVVYVNDACPPPIPATKTCPDGSVVPASDACPVAKYATGGYCSGTSNIWVITYSDGTTENSDGTSAGCGQAGPVNQTCPDGSVIPQGNACPSQVPAATQPCADVDVGGGNMMPATRNSAGVCVPDVGPIGPVVIPNGVNPVTCPDGTVPSGASCILAPVSNPATKTCPDGRIVLASAECPAPAQPMCYTWQSLGLPYAGWNFMCIDPDTLEISYN